MSASIIQFSPAHLCEVREIFFESSTRKNFKDSQEKESFYYKYLGFYLKHFRDLSLVAYDQKVLGYLLLSPTSEHGELEKIQPHLSVFREHFSSFPAHLHINCHFQSRGQGVGGELIKKGMELLVKQGIKGVHIVTSPQASNKKFYLKHGFHFEARSHFLGADLLFMGKTL